MIVHPHVLFVPGHERPESGFRVVLVQEFFGMNLCPQSADKRPWRYIVAEDRPRLQPSLASCKKKRKKRKKKRRSRGKRGAWQPDRVKWSQKTLL